MRGSTLFLCMAALACAPAPAAAQSAQAPGLACPLKARAMTRLELFFGAARKSGPPVSRAEWEAFLDEVITPRFPNGLSWFEGRGQWRDAAGAIVREETRMLIVWVDAAEPVENAIEAIRAAYATRFEQDSVMRVTGSSCVAF